MRFLIILFSLLMWSLTAAEDNRTVKCYNCTLENPKCLSLQSYSAPEKEHLLISCPDGCAVRITEIGKFGKYQYEYVNKRGCDKLEHCDEKTFQCCKCNFDGCNINNYCSWASTLLTTFIPKIMIVGILLRQQMKIHIY